MHRRYWVLILHLRHLGGLDGYLGAKRRLSMGVFGIGSANIVDASQILRSGLVSLLKPPESNFGDSLSDVDNGDKDDRGHEEQ